MGSDEAAYTVEFEPAATLLEQQAQDMWWRLLEWIQDMCQYTAYCAKKDYMASHPELIQKFTNAVQEDWNMWKPIVRKRLQP